MKSKGIIPINKPIGWTSFDVVNKIKHQVRPWKVGHLGTLDPMATGVLLVTVGKATKLFGLMQEKTKTYIATFKFGYETDTLDEMGEKLKETSIIPSVEQIKAVLPDFVGELNQIPPKFSAKSLNGKRAYDLARNKVEFELKPKKVIVNSINFISYENGELSVEIVCGSGTYIRAIGRDIAKKLNSLATMVSLVRTKIGNFDLEDCVEISNFDTEQIIPIKAILDYPEIGLDVERVAKILNGQKIQTDLKDGIYKLNDAVDTIALIEIKDFYAKMFIFFG